MDEPKKNVFVWRNQEKCSEFQQRQLIDADDLFVVRQIFPFRASRSPMSNSSEPLTYDLPTSQSRPVAVPQAYQLDTYQVPRTHAVQGVAKTTNESYDYDVPRPHAGLVARRPAPVSRNCLVDNNDADESVFFVFFCFFAVLVWGFFSFHPNSRTRSNACSVSTKQLSGRFVSPHIEKSCSWK